MKPKPFPPTFLVPLLPLTPFLGALGLSLPSTPRLASPLPFLLCPCPHPPSSPKALSAGWRRIFRFSPPRNQVLAVTRDSLPVAGPAFPCVEDKTCSGGPGYLHSSQQLQEPDSWAGPAVGAAPAKSLSACWLQAGA